MLFLYSIISVFIILFLLSLLFSLLKSIFDDSPPWIASSTDVVRALVQLPEVLRAKSFLDVGSGDGKIVVDLAKIFCKVEKKGKFGTIKRKFVGVEAVLWLWSVSMIKRIFSNRCIKKAVTFYKKDAFDLDMSQFDIIYFFMSTRFLKKFLPKLESELHPGSYVITNLFKLPKSKSFKLKNKIKVHPKEIFIPGIDRNEGYLYVYEFIGNNKNSNSE